MDTRDTPEQAELRRATRRLARELGPATVADLGDDGRVTQLTKAVREAGWLELRDDRGDGAPLASGVETAIVADELAARVADVPFSGAVLARDLARRAGVGPDEAPTAAACTPDLLDVAVVIGGAVEHDLPVVDGPVADGSRTDAACVVVADGDTYRLATAAVEWRASGEHPGADLTRGLGVVPAGSTVRDASAPRALHEDDLDAWRALGLAITSADLVGTMRGVLDVTVAYAAERKQFGAPVGSFQAVQHLLADACCLLEGSHSVALHASWAVDDLSPTDALAAGRVAKAYTARAARTVCETAVQVHGGIGNTWECIVHVYLRRALLSSSWFGDDGEQLRGIERQRLGTGAGGA